jgi:hypothetical protein
MDAKDYTLNRAIIEAAIQGFEEQKRRIDETIAELRAELRTGPAPAKKTAGRKAVVTEAEVLPATAESPAPMAKSKRKMSAATKKRMAAAQQKRWADKRASQIA